MHFHSDSIGTVDVAGNLLAIFIILALLSMLMAAESFPRRPSAPQAMTNETVPAPVKSQRILPYWDEHYLVVGGRIAKIGLADVARQMVENPNDRHWRSVEWYVVMLSEVDDGLLARRDVDSYLIEIRPDLIALERRNEPVGKEALEDWAERLGRRFSLKRAIPTFHVYDSGMDLFAQLYPRLIDAGVPTRWVQWPEGNPLRVTRAFWQYDVLQGLR